MLSNLYAVLLMGLIPLIGSELFPIPQIYLKLSTFSTKHSLSGRPDYWSYLTELRLYVLCTVLTLASHIAIVLTFVHEDGVTIDGDAPEDREPYLCGLYVLLIGLIINSGSYTLADVASGRKNITTIPHTILLLAIATLSVLIAVYVFNIEGLDDTREVFVRIAAIIVASYHTLVEFYWYRMFIEVGASN